MLVAAAFSNAENARKIADSLARYGIRAIAAASGSAVLRQMRAVTLVVCGARLEDMTAPRLRRMLPAEIPMLLLAPGAPQLAGIENLPAGLTRAQLCEIVLHHIGAQEALVARAKRAMIRRGGVDEAAAHRLLQKHAMNSGVSLRRAAEEILQKYGEDESI